MFGMIRPVSAASAVRRLGAAGFSVCDGAAWRSVAMIYLNAKVMKTRPVYYRAGERPDGESACGYVGLCGERVSLLHRVAEF